MRPLPPITVGHWRLWFPMADHSAVAVIEALLASISQEQARTPGQILRAALEGDPPLLCWAALQQAPQRPGEPTSVGEVADWLAARLLKVFEGPPGPARPPHLPDSDLSNEDWPARVAANMATALVARQLAAADEPARSEEAYLVALLGWIRDWGVCTSANARREDRTVALEAWRQFGGRPVAAFREKAIARLRSLEGDGDLAASRSRAAEVAARWQEPVPMAGCLPALVEKLRRLEDLELRFERTLEAEKLAAMAEFAAGAGHEINNPLTVIGGRAQLFLKQETDPERRRELALMNAQVKRAFEMIADMRLFARPPQPELERIELGALVARLAVELAPAAAERATALATEPCAEPLTVLADPVQIAVALRAVITNALEAVGYEGHLDVRWNREETEAVVRIADDGPGISPEHRRHIFDPYYSARQAGRGLGMGLSKCWRIVTLHGGRIDVESQPGRGATFSIRLPLVTAETP